MSTALDEHAEPAMRLDAVGFDVSGTILLKPMTLALPNRGMTGLVGQNGSGKSTLLKILARQQPPSRGSVVFEGRSLGDWPDREFARRVAYLPQYTPLASGLTVRELVELGRYPWHGALGRFSTIDREKVDEALTVTSTHVFADRFVDSLSGGERQRAWLAMLIAQDARLLLLDEPISALDVAHQLSVLGLVRRLCLEKRIAVVIVIHDINLAVRYCDEIVALKAGELIVRGSPAEFMTAARLREIYDVEMDVFPHPETGGTIAYVRGPGV